MTFRWWRSNRANAASSGTISSAAFAAAQHSSSAELRRRLLITLLEVLFYYYPSLLTATLSLFACFHIDPAGAANAEFHNAKVRFPPCSTPITPPPLALYFACFRALILCGLQLQPQTIKWALPALISTPPPVPHPPLLQPHSSPGWFLPPEAHC